MLHDVIHVTLKKESIFHLSILFNNDLICAFHQMMFNEQCS